MTPEERVSRELKEGTPAEQTPEPIETAVASQTEAPPTAVSSTSKDEIPVQPKFVEPQLPPGAPGFGDDLAEDQMRPISRRSFLWAGMYGLGVAGGLHWLNTRRLDDGVV